jgi:predicted RNA binding protein YcfA (HicA-like mRNA interferase family)
MARTPRLKGKELIRLLEQKGFVVQRIRGSHHSLRHPDGRYTVVPVHAGETIGPGLLLKILKDVDLKKQDLTEET